MAKKKRRAPKAKDTAATATVEVTQADEQLAEASTDDANDVAAEKFVGQWNRLVSTTNWEKGRIICDWRESLMTSGAAVSEYSDEAWAQLVGGVTSQHVGRLRRVYQRFGDEYDQYEGLFWSHFQAALDWDDAEMWLEGSIRNDWSISQMRGKRWETLGTPPEEQEAELAAEHDVDVESSQTEFASESAATSKVEKSTGSESSTAKPQAAEIVATESDAATDDDAESSTVTQPAQERRLPLNIDVDELPDDLAEAFESFKLAIIAHRREGWSETNPEAVVGCLDALRDLVLRED